MYRWFKLTLYKLLILQYTNWKFLSDSVIKIQPLVGNVSALAALTDRDWTSCVTVPQEEAIRYNLLVYRHYITTSEKSIILKLTVQNISSCKQVREFNVAYFPPEADQVVCDKLRYCALSADEPNELGAACSYKCLCIGNQCVLALLVIPLFKTNTTFCEVEVYKGINDFP